MSSPDPVLHLLGGPNGSGKTTLAERVLLPVTHLPFVNADVIAKKRWPKNASMHAYEAAQLAADERERLLVARRSFVAETVFSHASKLALLDRAQGLGYRVTLHVVLVPEELTVARVAHRVGQGGHDVPVEKVRERFQRLWPLLARARDLADVTRVYDNSSARHALRLVATYERGVPLGPVAWPTWTPAALR